MGPEGGSKAPEGLGSLLFDSLVVETSYLLRQPAKEERLPLPTSASDEGKVDARAALSCEGDEIVPFVIAVEKIGGPAHPMNTSSDLY